MRFKFLRRLHCFGQAAAVGDQADLCAGQAHAGTFNVHRARLGQFTLQVVELGVLKDQHRVGVGQGGCQHAARILQGGGRQNAQAGNVGIPAFKTVRVLRCNLAPCARGHAQHQRHRKLSTRHVVQEGCGVDNGVQRQQAEVDGHHLHDRPHTAQGRANTSAHKTQLRQGRVANALRAKLCQQAFGDGIGATIGAHVFAH